MSCFLEPLFCGRNGQFLTVQPSRGIKEALHKITYTCVSGNFDCGNLSKNTVIVTAGDDDDDDDTKVVVVIVPLTIFVINLLALAVNNYVQFCAFVWRR